MQPSRISSNSIFKISNGMVKKEFSTEVGGRKLTATFTDLADQTNGAVIMRYGETVVLVTAVMSKNEKEGMGYFPLTVDYEEKFYAAGKIGGGRFIKREGRPSDEAILSGRIIDRTIRPLFASHIRNEIQVVATVLSIDTDNDPDVLGVIGASLALGTSDIPWGGPVSSIRLGVTKDDSGEINWNNLNINPTYTERENMGLDLLVCGKDGNINMIEAEAKEIKEEILAKAFELASAEIEKIQAWQKTIIAEIGKTKKVMEPKPLPEGLEELFATEISPKMETAVFSGPGKDAIHALEDEWLALFAEKMPEENKSLAIGYYEDRVNDILHEQAIRNSRRPDDRKMNELRNISTEAGGLSEIVHGVGFFYRGGTHVMTILTLGGPKDSQLLEGMETTGKKAFMHHYNFPPFSVGETGRLGGINRRAVGHGALAEKSLRAVLPAKENFPYTIRLVSEALASNGSSSMGSVCASTLAMMDGGVPITRPVAGIAMGLMSAADGSYKILTDIQGPEDEHGDMDFKVAGTEEGVTGIQLDIKVDGIPVKVLAEAMTQAKEARLQIIGKIKEAIPAPRPSLKPSAPCIDMIMINPEKIGAVIGPGGKVIQKLSAETMTEIEIEDDGSVTITGKRDGVDAAKVAIEQITHEYKAGEKFEGEVTRLMEFGAFVRIAGETEGLVHVSEMAPFRIDRVTDAVKVGEKVPVIIKEIDEKNRINLSIRQADPEWAKNKGLVASTAAPRPPMNGGNRNGSGPRNGNGGGNHFSRY